MTSPEVLRARVIEVPAFLSARECAQFIQRVERSEFEQAQLCTTMGTRTLPQIRNNDRLFLDDTTLATELWQRIADYFTEPFKGEQAIGLNPRFRIYRYGVGQFFDWHQDCSYCAPDGSESRFTCLIFLNDGFEGGGTTFADVFSPFHFADFTITPEVGKLLLFHHPLSHRGEAVMEGCKYVLRSDVMFVRA